MAGSSWALWTANDLVMPRVKRKDQGQQVWVKRLSGQSRQAESANQNLKFWCRTQVQQTTNLGSKKSGVPDMEVGFFIFEPEMGSYEDFLFKGVL